MPWPAFLLPAHKVINPVARRLAGRVGSLALLTHRGRSTGREYRNPVRAFRRGDLVAVGVNFGRQSQWVRNVLAAEGCRMLLRGESLDLVRPRLVPIREMPPVFPRWFEIGLRHVVGTDECLLMEVDRVRR